MPGFIQKPCFWTDGLWYFGKDRFQRPLPPEWVSSMGSIYKLLKIHLCLLIYAAEEAEIAGSLLLGVSTSQERAWPETSVLQQPLEDK